MDNGIYRVGLSACGYYSLSHPTLSGTPSTHCHPLNVWPRSHIPRKHDVKGNICLVVANSIKKKNQESNTNTDKATKHS